MIDLSFLEKFTKGDTRKMKRYIQLYLKIAPETLKKMGQSITHKDWEQLRIQAHSLKPQSDYMGIRSLKSLLVEIENGVKTGTYPPLKSLYEQALVIHTKSEILLKESMAKMS